MALNVSGLGGDFYYSNNPIIINIQETQPYDYVTVKIGTFSSIVLTPVDNKITIDISSYIKSSIPEFNQTNKVVRLQIVIASYSSFMNIGNLVSSTTITKHFLFGGRRGNLTNQQSTPNEILKTTDKVPYWAGYPVIFSRLTQSSGVWGISNIQLDPSLDFADKRKVKGCNSIYIKFLNSLGGYSHWMFEGVTDQQKNTSVGTINNTRTIDLGSNYEQEFELYSKVPKAYISLMQDLIISPEIYVYKIGEQGIYWERHISGSNTIESIPAKSAQSIKIKLKPFNKFNPQVVWQ